jgi:DNA repair exonuclease SbcCD nuclease subunit
MRALIASDFHADAVTAGVSRFVDIKGALAVIENRCARGDIDAFIFLGDLADPDRAGRTIQAQKLAIDFALALRRMGTPSLWLAGNHDVLEDGTGLTTLSVLPHLQKVEGEVHAGDIVVSERREWLRFPEFRVGVLSLPYTARGVEHMPLAGTLPGCESYLVATHLSIPGASMGGQAEARGREDELPRSVIDGLLVSGVRTYFGAGHYHTHQEVAVGNVIVHIPGSPVRLGFADEDVPCGYLVEDV